MTAAARDFRRIVASMSIYSPTVPIVLNTTATATTDPDVLREELAMQVTQPVRWEASLRTLAQMGCDVFVELGPGQVLTGLTRRTLPGVQALAAGEPSTIEKAASLLTTNAAL